MNRKIKTLVRIVVIIGLIIGALLYIDRPRTKPFLDESGRPLPESVASLEDISLRGARQTILIRGRDRSKPLLLFLHGGPGMPAMYLAHHFQKDLEQHFVVVHWDQRGAGKSFHPNISPESMNVRQIMDDTQELTQLLRKRFQQERIYLVAHSWGTYHGILTVQEHPELFYAYTAIGQVAGTRDQEIAIQDRFITESAEKEGKPEITEDLRMNGSTVRETYLFQFGGELHNATSFMPLLLTGLRSPEYTFLDASKIPKGVGFSHRHMKYNVIQGPIMDNVKSLPIPAYFFTGRYDFTTPFELIEDFYETLDTPQKRLVWFEDSAHFPFFEEPAQFTREMLKVSVETNPY